MSIFKSLTFAGKDLREFGVVCSGSHTFNGAERDYTAVTIPGRNGELLLHGTRLKNIEVSYDCSIAPYFEGADFEKQIQALRGFLMTLVGYKKLIDGYHPDEYRQAYYSGPLEAEVGALNRWGKFTLTFSCKPQRYLISGGEGITIAAGGSVTLTNPDGCGAAMPTFDIPGDPDGTVADTAEPVKNYSDSLSDALKSLAKDIQGVVDDAAGYVQVGDTKIHVQLAGVTEMRLDCGARRAYEKDGSRDLTHYISAPDGFPKFPAGDTVVENHTSSDIVIYPNWFRV